MNTYIKFAKRYWVNLDIGILTKWFWYALSLPFALVSWYFIKKDYKYVCFSVIAYEGVDEDSFYICHTKHQADNYIHGLKKKNKDDNPKYEPHFVYYIKKVKYK